jgi:hypothetical protein
MTSDDLRLVLQVGGFADFEELLNDARDECHEAVEGALALQVLACCLAFVVRLVAMCFASFRNTACCSVPFHADSRCATRTTHRPCGVLCAHAGHKH